MSRPKITPHKVFLVFVEGDGEQSFVKWLQHLSNENRLHIHLDCTPLNGGSYKSMLENAVKKRKRKETPKSTISILIVDSDRTSQNNDWTMQELKTKAQKAKFELCLQHPNQEGVLFRMLPNNEHHQPLATDTHKLLRSEWPEYEKPVDARTLGTKFSLDDLLRVAAVDDDIQKLLKLIGLMP